MLCSHPRHHRRELTVLSAHVHQYVLAAPNLTSLHDYLSESARPKQNDMKAPSNSGASPVS